MVSESNNNNNNNDNMIRIDGGDFLQGSPEKTMEWLETEGQPFPKEWFEDETPQIMRHVHPYFIDRYPVTNSQFQNFVNATGYKTIAERNGYGLVYTNYYWQRVNKAHWKQPGGIDTLITNCLNHPVVHIAWDDANAYANWADKRLPSETEWELASRGTKYRIWPWGNEWNRGLSNTAEYWIDNSLTDLSDWKEWWCTEYDKAKGMPKTTPVGCFSPNGDSIWNVSDMAGNVYEWTKSDYWFYGEKESRDPMFEVIEGIYKVIRGGSWMNFRYQVRCSERIAGDPWGWSNFAIGFRCAKDAPHKSK